VPFVLTSSAFSDQGEIPARYTCEGEDLSPPLSWRDAPSGTESFVLIVDDPDAPDPRAPKMTWVHWVIYNIPGDVKELPEGIPRVANPGEPAAAKQGQNDFSSDNVGYRGPMPPSGSGRHRYFFHLYAVDSELDLPPDQATKAALLAALDNHILGEAELVGTFER